MFMNKLLRTLRNITFLSVATITSAAGLAGTAHAAANATMYVQAVNQMVVGSTFTIQVRLNTGGSHINAVQSDFTYNQAVLTFDSIDDASLSSFEISAEGTGGSGTVHIGRGTLSTGGVMGDVKVANITFDVIAAGTSAITFQGTSEADDATTNTDDLATKTNGSFTNVPGIGSGDQLTSGQIIHSSNSTFKTVMQSDGNFVVYNSLGKPAWTTNTSGNPGAKAYMQPDGNFVIYSSGGKPLWSSKTNGYPGSSLVMQNDGNLVIYNIYGRAIWSWRSGLIAQSLLTGAKLIPSDFLRATNMAYTARMQPDGNFVIYTSAGTAKWSTNTSGHKGAVLKMQSDGNMVLYSATGKALWSTGTNNNSKAHAQLQTDGNLVILSTSGKLLWSRTHGRY